MVLMSLVSLISLPSMETIKSPRGRWPCCRGRLVRCRRGCRRGRPLPRNYFLDEDAGGSGQTHLVGEIGPMGRLTMPSDGGGRAIIWSVAEDGFGRVDGDGEADSRALLRASGGDQRIDSDHFAARVSNGPPELPG